MLASLSFDARLTWDDRDPREDRPEAV